MQESKLRVRTAVAEDVSLIHALIRGLAEYEREPDAARLTEADLLRDGFGPAPAFFCLLAEYGGVGCGFALSFPIYSTWAGRSLYLEDLFVLPAYRGLGVGKALLTRTAALAVEQGCARLDWAVLKWNTPAVAFYRQLGAVPMSEWEGMRLAGPALADVAALYVHEAGALIETADHSRQPALAGRIAEGQA